MDSIDKFLKLYSYKFPKGYPDINDEQDILLLENILKELNVNFSLKEASLGGRTTNFSQPTGAFYKYVELNDSSDTMDFEI